MQEWHGAELVGEDIAPRVLLTDVYPIGGGDWAYRYSFAPGRSVVFVVRPGPGMLSPHDDTYARLVRELGAGYPRSAY